MNQPPPPPDLKKSQIQKKSQDILENKLKSLRKIIPEVFSEGKIDIEKFKNSIGGFVDSNDERYTLNWAGRTDTFKNIQISSIGTLVPNKKESINFDDTKNIFIEGENLEVLKLLQKSYFEKIKCIYIDPPYNTGKDFIYKDNFYESAKSYLEQTGQSNDGVTLTTNPDTAGRFHSNWLSFMYARLFLARNLLSDDGMIFVSIDDNEVHDLRIIMNEIFGEENFVTTMIWKSRTSLQYSEPLISSQTEFIIVFVKNKELWNRTDGIHTNKIKKSIDDVNYSNPDNDPLGGWISSGMIRNDGRKKYTITTPSGKKYVESWLYSEENMKKFHKENRLWYGVNQDSKPRKKSYLSEYEGRVSSNLLLDKFIQFESGLKKKIFEIGNTESGTNELKQMIGSNAFDYPKPSSFITYLIKLYPDTNSTILDFFAGSGTTAHAVMELNNQDGGNRKFICVQIPEKCPDDSPAHKLGFSTIADICKERIRRAIKQIKQKKSNAKSDLGFKVFKLAKSNYKIWENYNGKDEKVLKEQIKLFESPLIEKYKDEDVIYEYIIKEGYDLNSTIEKMNIPSNIIYKVTDGDKSFYICLDKIIQKDIITETKITANDILICMDSALDDSQKTNLSKQCDLRML